jgi:hypothetical protein
VQVRAERRFASKLIDSPEATPDATPPEATAPDDEGAAETTSATP